MACSVDEGTGEDLGDDGDGLDAEGVGGDCRLREALFIVFEPQEEHALKGEGFEHGADYGEGDEDVTGGMLEIQFEKGHAERGKGGTYIVGDAKMRLTKLRKAMLCVSLFLGGIRLRASCFSGTLRYLTVVDSGRSGKVNYASC
jgi:hypothetical protein